MVSVTFDSVVKTFDKNTVIKNLTLHIKEGELFFLLGPSGCGKTTCLRTVAGFYLPDAGELRFNDRVMNRVPPHQRNTGMVFQNYALWPHLTARGNVEYGLKVRKVSAADRKKRADEALEMVRLGGYGDRYPSQMSGGQQQRVALARALVIRPDVLLLDEPLSNLDAQLRLEMRREIKRLHEETNTTAVYVTHDQDEALSIADRIAVLKDGVLMQVGAPRELYRRPVSRFVSEFMGETNFIPGTFSGQNNASAVIETPLGTLRGALSDPAPSVGQQVWCSVRPESWKVERAVDSTANDGLNRLPARLQSAMYLGEREQYTARLEGGTPQSEAETWRNVKVALTNPGELPPQPGEAVTLAVASPDIIVLSN